LCSFALTLLADLILYQPMLDWLSSSVNGRVSVALCQQLEVREPHTHSAMVPRHAFDFIVLVCDQQAEVKPFLLMYRVGGLIEGGHAAANAALAGAKGEIPSICKSPEG
jgi:hypothetical protein